MANDRGTMQRGGSLSGAPEQGMWEPTAPAGRRLPTAPRERKPALAALALLLIVGGALGAGFLVIQSGKRVAAVEISSQVGAGQQIPVSAMRQIQVAADTGVQYVPWDEASQVARFFASTTIPAGTLLTRTMVVQSSAATNGKDVLGLALKDGQWPPNLTQGDRIAVFSVASSSSTGGGCPGAGGTLLTGDASVIDINTGSTGNLVGSSQTGGADVTVAIPPSTAGAVACNASAGNVAVAVLPAGGQQPAAVPPATTPAPRKTPKSRQSPAGAGAASPGATRPAGTGTGHG